MNEINKIIQIADINQKNINLASRGSILSFDFGLRRIGVAVGELELKTAHPLETIHKEDNASRFQAIEKLIKNWQPIAFLVGLPYHVDGESQEMTQRAFKFARQLEGRFHLPTFGYNECLTSRHAETSLYELGINSRKQKNYIDQVSALHLLESWFNFVIV